jgi:hypothetical protein
MSNFVATAADVTMEAKQPVMIVNGLESLKIE